MLDAGLELLLDAGVNAKSCKFKNALWAEEHAFFKIRNRVFLFARNAKMNDLVIPNSLPITTVTFELSPFQDPSEGRRRSVGQSGRMSLQN